MPDGKATKKPKKAPSPLLGAQAQPTTLDQTTKIDIDVDKSLIDNIIEASLSHTLDIGALQQFTTISNARDQVYQLIDTMCNDSTVSSIVRAYTQDACQVSDNGHIVWCESDDQNISKFVNYLLNVMNVDKYIASWVYMLIKYGDVYLKLFRESDYEDKLFDTKSIDKAFSARSTLNEDVNISLHSIADPYSYYIEAVPDPSTMYELTKFGKTYGYIEVPNEAPLGTYTSDMFLGVNNGDNNVSTFNYRYKSGDVIIHQADDYVHACLVDNISRYPETVELFTNDDDYKAGTNAQTYTVKRGKSMLYDSYKIWREKQLLETSILLNRVTRSSIVRMVGVEVGNMPKEQVQQTLRRTKELFEQKSAVNTDKSFSEYTNPSAVENNIYFATHNGIGNITVSSVGGDVNVKDIADLDDWVNRFYASYGIPKQYFGYTDDAAGFNGGSSLTVLSSVYSRGVGQVQNAIIQALTDAINLILLNKGFKSYLNNFVLKMKAPLTQEELSYRANFVDRINAISNLNSLFSDIEDKSSRLALIKNLVATLNYGDDLLDIIQEEIEKAKVAEAKAAAQAEKEEKEALAAGEGGAGDSEGGEGGEELPPVPEEPSEEEPTEEENPEDFNLPPMPESLTFNTNDTEPLVEGIGNEANDSLPTPEELAENVDFTENK